MTMRTEVYVNPSIKHRKSESKAIWCHIDGCEWDASWQCMVCGKGACDQHTYHCFFCKQLGIMAQVNRPHATCVRCIDSHKAVRALHNEAEEWARAIRARGFCAGIFTAELWSEIQARALADKEGSY